MVMYLLELKLNQGLLPEQELECHRIRLVNPFRSIEPYHLLQEGGLKIINIHVICLWRIFLKLSFPHNRICIMTFL